ncbi:hypothetical protein ACQZ5N_12255, partial [Agrobacterium sp. 22-221-1]
MICSSVKRLRFIPWSSQWARAYFKMDYFNGARSAENRAGSAGLNGGENHMRLNFRGNRATAMPRFDCCRGGIEDRGYRVSEGYRTVCPGD